MGAAACQRVEPPPPAEPSTTPAPSVSAPFDLSAVMRQVRTTFRKEGTRFVGGQDTYSVEVDAAGAVDFRPRQPAGTLTASTEGSPLTLETVRVGRQGAGPTPAPRVEQDAKGGLVIHRGAVRERLRDHETAVEQSWEFPERPEGDGPLTVRVRVRGQRFVASTEAGLHFTGGNGPGTRYGLATWVDARGVSTPLPSPRFEHGELVLQVPESLLESSAYPAVLDPLVTPESDVGQPVLGSAGSAQTAPQLAFDGTNYLAVWQDRRQGAWRIYGARISPTGELLDAGGISLATSSGNEQQQPAIAFNGTDYLVVWSEGSLISATRVSKAGVVLDPSGITVRTGSYARGAPAVASDGKDFLVVWRDYYVNSSITDILLARVSGAGKLIDTNPTSIASFAYTEAQPAVAYVNGYYLILWEQGASPTTLWGLSVTPTLDATQGTRFQVTTEASARSKFRPALASYGTGALATWADGRGTSQQVYGVRLSPRGTRLDAADLLLSGTTVASEVLDISAAFDGANVHVAWTDTSLYESGKLRVRGTRVSLDGKVLDAGKLLGNTALYTGLLAAASDGARVLVVWASGLSETSDISGTLVDRDGVALDSPPRLISQAANRESDADVAFDGSNYFIVWADARNGESDIYGAWVDRSGNVLNPEGLRITRTGGQNAPRVAASGTDLLVVWIDYRTSSGNGDVYAARVLRNGTVLEPDGIPVATGTSTQLNARVASDGTDYLIVWTDLVFSNAVKGAFVRGGKVGAALTLASTGGNPTVAFQGTRYLTAWVANNDIEGVRVERSGGVVDSVPLGISKASGSQMNPTLAASGTGFLAVWQDTRTAAASGIYAARVTPEGDVLDPTGLLISLHSGSFLAPKATFDGTSYVLAWHYWNGSQRDIRGNRVTQSGAVLDGNGFVITEALDHENGGQLASDGQGNTLVVYDRLERSVGTAQARFRFVRSLVAGQACAAASDCASGFCVDGVCCDSACGGGVAGDCQACSVAAGGGEDGRCAPVGAGTQCRASAGTCDVAELCDGESLECPAERFVPVGTECRASAGACDVAESCTGSSAVCPADALAEEGSACDDGNACTTTDMCQSGSCTGSGLVVCTASDACHAEGTCDPRTGVCSNPAREDGTLCPDGTCQAGACMPPPDAGTGETPDAGTGETPDAGSETPDAGPGETPDAGTETPDAGTGETPDAGSHETPDAGTETPDAGSGETPDAGTGEMPDAGTETPDAGPGETPDAGTGELPDAGTGELPDAGPETPDAGAGEIPDGGSEPDADNPTEDAGSRPSDDNVSVPVPSGGCGCGAPGTTNAGFLVLLMGLALLRRPGSGRKSASR